MDFLVKPTPWAMGVVHALNGIAPQTIAHRVDSYNKISAWLTNTGAIQSSGAG